MNSALASYSFGILLLQWHPEPSFETHKEDGHHFTDAPWVRSALVLGLLSSGL